MYVIETNDLTRKFGDITAVDGLSLRIEAGEVFGLLGPNGAGKSTTLNMLCTILKPTSGKATINGLDVDKHPDKVRQIIGIVFQDPSIDNRLTGRENLEMHAELYNVDPKLAKERIGDLLTLVELDQRAGEVVKNYSGGMRRRLEIARGLIHHPKVLFLDEPTIGLDPQTRAKIWEYIKRLSDEEDITIILTTHYMDEAELLCDRVGIIDHGKIVALGSPKELIREIGQDVATVQTDDNSRAKEFESAEFVKKVTVGAKVTIVLDDSTSAMPRLFEYASKKGIRITSIELRRPTLNDVFLLRVGRELREEHGDGKDAVRRRMHMRGIR
ncbi:MAG: ATP-binding cassette domain-containing protein [Candidatus Altiarchaeota archaeon]